MPPPKELRDEYVKLCDETNRQREQIENDAKTIAHLTAAHKVLVERLDLAHSHNRALRKLMVESARKERERGC